MKKIKIPKDVRPPKPSQDYLNKQGGRAGTSVDKKVADAMRQVDRKTL